VLLAENLTDLSAKEAIIRFHPDAAEGFDLAFDGYYLQGFGPMFYSMAGSKRLSVNTLPAITDDLTIPLAFAGNGSGEPFRITLSETLQDVDLYLIDLKAEKNVNLSDLAIYQFKVEQGDNPNRFLLKFGATGTHEPAPTVPFTAWTHNGTLYINGIEEPTKVEVFDMPGRLVMLRDISNAGMQTINLHHLSGFYLVRISSDSQTSTIKVAL
jgi:hypothetical protein